MAGWLQTILNSNPIIIIIVVVLVCTIVHRLLKKRSIVSAPLEDIIIVFDAWKNGSENDFVKLRDELSLIVKGRYAERTAYLGEVERIGPGEDEASLTIEVHGVGRIYKGKVVPNMTYLGITAGQRWMIANHERAESHDDFAGIFEAKVLEARSASE